MMMTSIQVKIQRNNFCSLFQDGIFGPTFVPVQDGLFYSIPTEGFLPEAPDDYRREGIFARVPTIVGINANDGAQIASNSCFI